MIMEILKKKIFSVILCSFVIHFIGLNAYAGMGRTSSGGSPLAGLVLSGGGSSGTSSSSLSSVVPIVSGAENMNNTFAGAMNYSIPIEVPRGRNGMDPGLALTYNNYVGNGWIGLGWELEVGDIERNPRFGVKLDGNDFILRKAGAVIELVPDANVTGLYHAKIEGQFNRIMQFVSSSGTYWEVTDRKGVVFRYGQATASRQDDPTGTNVFKWCLDQVVDTNGNYMTLSYQKTR